MKKLFILSLVAAASFFVSGCKTARTTVIASTGTCLGFEVAENPATGLYQVKLGYARAELALVPTNKGETNNFANGAADTSDVLMELQFKNLFKGGGVYQRLAVGKTAVTQPGASLMFAKDASGVLSSNAAIALTGLKSVTKVDAQGTAAKVGLAAAYETAPDKAPYDEAAKKSGFASFVDFLSSIKVTPEQVDQVKTYLKTLGISL